MLFCDLVGSTALSECLDPEELREVVRAYQETCTEVIRRYDGHIAQHLGDGLLVYFGYPLAHEDDAARAVRAGIEIIEALQTQVPSPLVGEGQGEGVTMRAVHTSHPNLAPQGGKELRRLQVRIGIHTGLVVIGEIGSSEKREMLALGETPNIAARLQSLAEPDTVVISAATQRLVTGLFESQDLGPQTLKGISIPLSVYQVIGESTTQSRFDAALIAGLTPLVGREEELALLRRRWEQVKDSTGQVVLLSGEPGIGKSRLVQALKEYVSTENAHHIEFRCSAYHQNSAYYPILEHLKRFLQFHREDAPQAKLAKLQHALVRYRFPQADTFPLLAALFSLPHPEGAPPITWSPQKQKQRTQEALVAWIVEEAEKTAVYCVWEDLHWADPSTLEVLTLYLDQVPTARLLALLTFRPDFAPPWRLHSYITNLTLNRLGQSQVEAMVEQVTKGNALPAEVVQQIVNKTDGVPLFVEELTKMVIETMREQGTGDRVQEGKFVGTQHAAPVPTLGIPTTLHDALMARLDRLGPAKEIAQMGATIGREFSYEVLHAVSSVDEETLQHGLRELVETELVYQRGVPPQATYLFKHALIQDTAYQLLLKSTRQQYHSQIAHILEERFSETVEMQPELVAHHYTEAGYIPQAIPYWQKAGQKANQRSAHTEAIGHLTKGLELLKTLPDTVERVQQELTLQTALGMTLILTKGHAAPEVEAIYTRARELCQQIGETSHLFSVLLGLRRFYFWRGELHTAHELGEQLLTLAQNLQDSGLLARAHMMQGEVLYYLGEFIKARDHLDQGSALYDPRQHRSHAFLYGSDSGVGCLFLGALALEMLGHPDQASKKSHEALSLVQELNHSFSLAFALYWASLLRQRRREARAAQERAETLVTLANEQGFALWEAWGAVLWGWALAEQGQGAEGIARIRQGLEAWKATGGETTRTYFLTLLAEAYGKVGQTEEGMNVLAEALAMVDKTGEHCYEAEMYRLKGELLLTQESKNQKSNGKSQKSEIPDPKSQILEPQLDAEACFLKAIEIARKQQAKSLELRAVMSLTKLWQQQGKQHEARNMLSEVYYWFTEGFDTKDLQEAKTLLDQLSLQE